MAQDETPVDHVDVLIVGAGPAGLMMANWMSRWGVRTRIVDKRGTKVSDRSVIPIRPMPVSVPPTCFALFPRPRTLTDT